MIFKFKNTDSLSVMSDVCNVLKSLDNNNNTKKNRNQWSKDEHLLFLIGLNYYGKDYKKISMKFVKTRTHVQVRTHAQKYFKYKKNNY